MKATALEHPMSNTPSDGGLGQQSRCRAELERYLGELGKKIVFYRHRAAGCYFWWKLLEVVTLVSGALTAIIAGLMEADTFKNHGGKLPWSSRPPWAHWRPASSPNSASGT